MSRLYHVLFPMFLVALLIAGCGGTPSLGTGKEITIETESFSFSDDKFDLFTAYRISPGDQLDVLFSIQTWEKEASFLVQLGDSVTVKFLNAPQYNETQNVRPDGRITLPFIGSIEVAGKSIEKITAELKGAYQAVFQSPEIAVVVPEYLSQIRELKKDLHTASRGLSRLVTVRPDGYTTFPMVGEFLVGGRTIHDVGKALNDQYRKISPSLKVDLFLEQYSGAQIYLLGNVQRPGAYPIRRPMIILEALALAGGTNTSARLDEVMVIRKSGKSMVATQVNVEKTLSLSDGTKLFYVSNDDIIFVPEDSLVAAERTMNRIMNILMFRGWGVTVPLFTQGLINNTPEQNP